MARISVGGYDFYVLPNTVSWSYAMKIQTFDTYDGRVTQLLACNIESLTMEGYIPLHTLSGGGSKAGTEAAANPAAFVLDQWSAMERFEASVKQVMARHSRGARALSEDGKPEPARIHAPEFDWDSSDNLVYLVGYSDVRYEPDTPAVKYTLKFEVVGGFEKAKQDASDHGMSNIPDGVGWVRNIYNTPDADNWETFKTAMENYVDDAGTFDASNPPDFYQYLDEAENADENDDDIKKAARAAYDAEYTVTKGVTSATTTVMQQLGIKP